MKTPDSSVSDDLTDDAGPAGPSAAADRDPQPAAAGFVVSRAALPVRALRGCRDYMGALAAFVVIVVILSVTQDGFLSVANLQNVLQSNAPLFLVSIGMTFVVISGGFDLSVGAMMAVSEEVLMVLINDVHMNPLLAIIITVLICGIGGALTNGVAIGVLKLNFFVTTLGAMILLQGIVLVASQGNTTSIKSAWLQKLGNNNVGDIPVPVLICAGLLVVAWFVLRLTAYGRSVYAVGGNPEAARLSGIAVPAMLLSLYAISGMCGALAGVVDAARLDAATPTAGSNIALTSAAAVLLGGASLAGGVGKLAGTTIGVLVLALLGNGVDLFGISAYWQDVVTGAVLLIAILLDRAHKSGVLGRVRGRRTPTGQGSGLAAGAESAPSLP